MSVTDIREPDRICMDCGKLFLLAHAHIEEEAVVCPRCASNNHREYVKAEHEDITIEVPEGWSEHPLEDVARKLFDRVAKLTEWREVIVRLWFQTANPLLGNVSPEWMIMNNRADRLSKFIDDAEYFNAETTEP